jgi:acetyl-CoA synthetase
MAHSILGKSKEGAHNLRDYEAARAEFTWSRARGALDGLPGGAGLNIAHEAVDRHVASRGGDLALRCIDDRGARDFSFAQLQRATNRFANVLRALGVARGDRVFTLLGPVPELWIAVLGSLKAGCVAAPLFSAFGPEPVATRMRLGKGRVLVTTDALYRKKVAPIRAGLVDLEHVLLVHDGGTLVLEPGTRSLQALLDGASDHHPIAPTDPEEPALLHFTSGTTGLPKGAVHVHDAVVAHHQSARLALDLQRGDRYWCTADPGWVTGTSYGVVAPLACGVTTIAYDGPFDPERWYHLLQDERVTVWYTAPTAVRMCMRAGADLARRHDLRALRFVASVGEPLNAEAVVWGVEALGQPIHDNWWQTETGAIMIANFAATEVRPGSMGRPMPGIEVALVHRDGERIEVVREPGAQGEIALTPGWPSMFRGYLGDDQRYAKCFAGGFYLSGDLARRDADGWLWFSGRADDVIKSAGHLIGPFEVESALMEHPAVLEAGVIGKPDPVAHEVVKAFVALRPGQKASDELAARIMAFARKRLGPAVAPREIVFQAELPRTRSGKIMRRLLRARELGLPTGDLSTLEGAAS